MHAERRLSITTRPCVEKPRMLKRRSLDFGALFYHHEVVDNMDTIEEDNSEGETGESANDHDGKSTTTGGPQAGTWAMETEQKERRATPDLTAFILRAEREMEQMELHLHKLEDFLEQTDDEEEDESD